MQNQGTTVDVAGVLPDRSRPVVCHANRSLLADRDGNEGPATAVAVVCPPTAVGPWFARRPQSVGVGSMWRVALETPAFMPGSTSSRAQPQVLTRSGAG